MPSAASNTLPAPASPVPLEGRSPLTYKGERVLTTGLAAKAFGADEKVLRKNFERNDARFEEGKHFFVVKGSALKAIKDHTSFRGVVDPRAAHLYLWTERGVARHAKILETEAAWGIFEALEDTYFRVKEGGRRADPKPKTYGPAEIRRQWAFGEQIAAAAGLFGHSALFAVNRATKAATNFDVLDAMGATHLVEPIQERRVAITLVGAEVGLTAAKANRAMEEAGYQTETRTPRGRLEWKLTEDGRALGAEYDRVGRAHADGTAQVILWPFDAAVEAIRAHLQRSG